MATYAKKRRRQETLWIHRWARPIIGGIAAVGAAGTGYLTLTKLMNSEAACAAGCDRVLNSSWAELFGLPLTLFGFLAYAAMLVLAVVPLFVKGEENAEQRTKLEGLTWPLLFVGATGMMVFSGFLMYVLFTSAELAGAICPYCIASALMSTSMFALVLLGRRWVDRGQLLFSGVIIAMVALVGTFGVYAANGQFGPTAADGAAGPAVTTPSGEAEVALANHLTEIDAKMYGAYWCSHCHDQKQLFGKEAYTQIPYVECTEDGQGSQAAACQAVPEIQGFPTWEVNGQFLSGTQSLQALAEASGYEGPTNFANN